MFSPLPDPLEVAPSLCASAARKIVVIDTSGTPL
jgi:hypothetical protein